MQSVKEIITQVPIETRPATLDKPERLIGLLSAEVCNRIREFFVGVEIPRVDIWNTVAKKIEKEHEFFSSIKRGDGITHQINERYRLLEDFYGLDTSNRLVLRDDSPEYHAVVQTIISKLINRGVFEVDDSTYSYCGSCDYLVSGESGVCAKCENSNLEERQEKALFMNLPDVKREALSSKVLGRLIDKKIFSQQGIKGYINSMPERKRICKQREGGVDLSAYGINEKLILEPLIALFFIPDVIRELTGNELKLIVQGFDSLRYYLPWFTHLAYSKTDTKFLQTGLIDPGIYPEAAEHDTYHFRMFLAFSLLGQRTNLGLDSGRTILSTYKNRSVAHRNADIPYENQKVDQLFTELTRLALNYDFGNFRKLLLKNKVLFTTDHSTHPKLTQLKIFFDEMFCYDIDRYLLNQSK